MIDKILRKIGRLVPTFDIRHVYKIRRMVSHFLVRNAARVNDGHYDMQIPTGEKSGRTIPVRIYPAPANADTEKFRIIVFFHGGGWTISDLDVYHKMCAAMAQQTGCYVFSAAYRLAPEHKFPDGFKDCCRVCSWIYSKAEKYNIPKRRIILAGDSAGGNLCAAAALYGLKSHKYRVSRMMLFYPVTACEYDDDTPYRSVIENGTGCFLTQKRLQGFLELYLKNKSQKDDPYAAPIKAKSLRGMPDTLILTAENDPLRDEGEAFGKKLRRNGCRVWMHRVEGAYHGFMSGGTAIRSVRDSYKRIRWFLRRTD